MPWKPAKPGEIPSLGWIALEWLTNYIAAPNMPIGSRASFIPTREQAQFWISYFSIDPLTGRRRYRRGVYSRPKGAGKSPMGAATTIMEAMAPVQFAGWDANGQPVGKPWSASRTVLAQVAAVSEDQTRNAWVPLLEMIRESWLFDDYPGLEPLEGFVNLPKGRIEPVTASAVSREGNPPVFVLLDQTESWVSSNGGTRLAATIRRNLGKVGGASLELPNAFIPGMGSVAEKSATFHSQIQEGRSKVSGLIYDHREAPADTDLGERESLLEGLRYAYGESAEEAGGWVDLDRIVAEIWDPATHPQEARQFYLNQITHASDSWLSQPEWASIYDEDKEITPRDPVVLGFDGSRQRSGGITDATALIGCRVSDGHLFEVGVWEQPETMFNKDWAVPTFEVDRVVREAFSKYNVVGFYADPARWETYIASWEADFGRKLKVKATRQAPITVSLSRTAQVSNWIDTFHTAVVNGEMSHDGSSALTRHILNARRRPRKDHILIMKEHPESTRKIDAAYAAVLAWAARLDAVAAGANRRKSRRLAY